MLVRQPPGGVWSPVAGQLSQLQSQDAHVGTAEQAWEVLLLLEPEGVCLPP